MEIGDLSGSPKSEPHPSPAEEIQESLGHSRSLSSLRPTLGAKSLRPVKLLFLRREIHVFPLVGYDEVYFIRGG